MTRKVRAASRLPDIADTNIREVKAADLPHFGPDGLRLMRVSEKGQLVGRRGWALAFEAAGPAC